MKSFAGNIFLFLCFIFIGHYSFGQKVDVTLDLKSKRQILFEVLGKRDKGILVISHNLNNKDLYLHYYNQELKKEWEVSIKNEKYGYIDPYSDSKTLFVYFTSKYIYLLHNYINPLANRKIPYVVQIDYDGNAITKKIKLPKHRKIEYCFISDDKIYLLASNTESIRKQYYSYELSPAELSLLTEQPINFPEYLAEWDISYIKNGLFYFFGNSAEYKQDNSFDVQFITATMGGEINYNNSFNFKLESGYPIPDFKYSEVSGSTTYFYIDSYTHLYTDNANSKHYVFGLISDKKNGFISKKGLYVLKYNNEGDHYFKKEFLFKDLVKHCSDMSNIDKSKNYISHLYVDPKSEDIIYILSNYRNPNKQSYCFLLQKEGFVKQVFKTNAGFLKSSHRNVLDVIHNAESNYGLSPFYSGYLSNDNDNNGLKILSQYNSKYRNIKNAPVFNYMKFENDYIIIEYSESKKQVILHGIPK